MIPRIFYLDCPTYSERSLFRRKNVYIPAEYCKVSAVGARVIECKVSRHNIAGVRYDVWFTIAGDANVWHGFQCGNMTTAIRCTRTKKTVASLPYWKR